MADAQTTTAAPESAAADAPLDDVANYLSYFVDGGLSPELRLEILDQLAADGQFFRSGDEAVKTIEPEWADCVAEVFEFESGGPSPTPRIVGVITDEAGRERLLVALVDENDPAATVVASVTIPACEIFETLP